MNSPEGANQRTGQPRCVQLMAKTWNCSPSSRRTQQAIFAVGPSQATRNGLFIVARRVSPSGNSSTGPS